MHVLGISAWRPGSAACLVRDGRVVAAAAEAGLSRSRDDAVFPLRAAESVLRSAGIGADELGAVAVHGRSAPAAASLVEWIASSAPRGLPAWMQSGPAWLRGTIGVGGRVRRALEGFAGDVVLADDDDCRAAAAFLPSPFRSAAILALGSEGAGDATTIASGDGRDVRTLCEIPSPHSLALLEAAFCRYLGLTPDRDESPWEGLGRGGDPRFVQRIADELIDLKDDGSFRLRVTRLGGGAGRSAPLARLLGAPARAAGEPLGQFHRDVAASVGAILGETILCLARHAMDRAGSRRLCISGGAALSPEVVGRLVRSSACERLWVQPASSGTAGAIGAALGVWFARTGSERRTDERHDAMRGGYVGPSWSESEIRDALRDEGARATAIPWTELTDHVAALLAEGSTCGWFQGHGDVGGRGVGARSVLGDPRIAGIRGRIGAQMRAPEPGPPVVAAVLSERAPEWFDGGGHGRQTTIAAHLTAAPEAAPTEDPADGSGDEDGVPAVAAAQPSSIAALASPGGSTRVHAVSRESNALFHRLVRSFEQRTGCPVVAHAALRVPGEPAAATPAEAIRCFRRTRLDYLVLGRFVVARRDVAEWKTAERARAVAAE